MYYYIKVFRGSELVMIQHDLSMADVLRLMEAIPAHVPNFTAIEVRPA